MSEPNPQMRRRRRPVKTGNENLNSEHNGVEIPPEPVPMQREKVQPPKLQHSPAKQPIRTKKRDRRVPWLIAIIVIEGLLILLFGCAVLLYVQNGWAPEGVSISCLVSTPTPMPTTTPTPIPTSTLIPTSAPTSVPTPYNTVEPKATTTPVIIGLAEKAEENSSGQSYDKQLLEFQKQLNDSGAALRAVKDTKNYSYSEEEVWQYCMDRWAYYDKLEGGYSGDKYTNSVFKDTGSKFGISASEAERIWNKVDRSKYGLD